jgi:LPXTG-motif cell wall-anchored protein
VKEGESPIIGVVTSQSISSDNGTGIIAETSIEVGKCTIKAYYVTENGDRNIVMKFPEEYQLPEGYTYSVTAVIQPTKEAYKYYLEHGAYPQDESGKTTVGGSDTGTESAGKEGFYSNNEANVSYSFGGASKSESYAVPVIQVSVKYDWTLAKISTSRINNADPLGLAGAIFTLSSGDDVVYTGTSIVDEKNTGTVEWYEGNSVDVENKKVSTISPGAYTLKETKAPAGYARSTSTWEVTIDKNQKISIETQGNDINKSESLSSNKLDNGIAIVVEDETSIEQNYTIYVEDAPLYDLPDAGHAGIYWLVFSGIALMMSGALLVFMRRRRMFRI